MNPSRRICLVLTLMLFVSPAFAKTWFVRSDGGTRYSTNVPTGQCDGKSDAAYPGSGTNQHCAFSDLRYMWDDHSGKVGQGTWIIAGGDTVLIHGCSARQSAANIENPHCRLGWDNPTGTGDNLWCYAVGSYTCYNPPIPSGTAEHHTRILGQNYAHCNSAGSNNPKDYSTNLTQLFGGFSLQYAFNLENTQFVDIECIELTTHNGRCTRLGSPAYPRPCRTDQPLDDYAQSGFRTNNKTSNLLLQDVYIHGFNASGLEGAIGGPVSLVRFFSGFNAFSGWNFDDGHNTPNGPGSSIDAHHVTMIGNGCYEEYPIKHAFPAQACYDDNSGGFGDAWSGQDTDLDSFTCDHCLMAYNTKDAFIGPHTYIRALTIVNSQSYGNMGAQWKWNNSTNAMTMFENNVTVGNCLRMSSTLPGAAHSFDHASHEAGAYLSDYCRAGGNTVAINSQQNSRVLFLNNTFVNYLDTGFLLSCGPNNNNHNKACGNTPFVFQNNIFLGYHLANSEPPGLFYIDDPSIKVTSSHNIEFGNRSGTGENCKDNLCVDPRLINQPPQKAWTNQNFLDFLQVYPQADSPANGRGVASSGLTLDHYGSPRPSSPTIGAVEPHRLGAAK